MTEQRSFVDADGVQISYRQWDAATPRGAVVIAHGASEHSARYERFATALTGAGWTVLAPDHRGHGATAQATGPGVIGPRALDGVLDDLDHVVTLAHGVGGPVVLFGHSLGSVVSLRYAETRAGALAALALSGPLGVVPGADAMVTRLQGAVDSGMGDQPTAALASFNEPFEPARTNYDWLSRDPGEVDKYVADPLCGDENPLSYGWLLAAFRGAEDGAADVDRLPSALPVLIIAGERDSVSNFTANARELASRLRGAGLAVTEKYYPQARHEILNETNRDEVTADILEWISPLA